MLNFCTPVCLASDTTGIEQPVKAVAPKTNKTTVLKGVVKETDRDGNLLKPALQTEKAQMAAPGSARTLGAGVSNSQTNLGSQKPADMRFSGGNLKFQSGVQRSAQSARGKKYVGTESNPFSESQLPNGRRGLPLRGRLNSSPYFKAWQTWESNVYHALEPNLYPSLGGRDYIGLVCFDLIVAANGDIKSMNVSYATGRDAAAIVSFGRQYIRQNHPAASFAFPGNMGVQVAHIFVFFDFY